MPENDSFQPDAFIQDTRRRSVRKQHLQRGIFPVDWWEYTDPNDTNPQLISKSPYEVDIIDNLTDDDIEDGDYIYFRDESATRLKKSPPPYVTFTNIAEGDWDYTASRAGRYYGDAGDSDRVFNLPSAVGSGIIIAVVKYDDGTGDIDVTPDGTDNINGLNEVWKINGQYQYVVLQDRASGEWAVLDCLGTLLEFTSDSVVSITSPNSNTWYNPTGHSLSVTPGRWHGYYEINVDGYESSGHDWRKGKAGFSTANNTSGPLDRQGLQHDHSSTTMGANKIFPFHREFDLDVASTTTYYLNLYWRTSIGGALNWLKTAGNSSLTKIHLRRIA